MVLTPFAGDVVMVFKPIQEKWASKKKEKGLVMPLTYGT